jgi:hypothetical protein
MSIETSTIRRLSFIKYLFNLGIGQSNSPEPLAAASLLTFHDAVELFLQLSSEHLNSGSNQPGFMDYWELIGRKLPENIELSQKESMRRLNKARVALKHHGTLPSKLDVDSFRGTTNSFFLDNTPIIFGIEFNEITLFEYLKPDVVRDHLKAADKHIESNNLEDATKDSGLAFELLINSYEKSKTSIYYRSPFFFGKDLTFNSSFFMGLNRDRDGNRKMAEFVDKVKESLESMQQAIKVMALGIDYRRYSKFKLHTPNFIRTMDGAYHPQKNFNQDIITSVEDAKFCISFVVEAAITLQDFDYEISVDQNRHGS